MWELGKYHARGVHQWNGGKCSFHLSIVCSYQNCNDDDNLQCEGKPYKSKFVLYCELHSLGYEIECKVRASSAEKVIYPIMGQGYSNLCEAAFSLPRYRTKSLVIHCLPYIMSCSPDPSPYILFQRIGLPILDGWKIFGRRTWKKGWRPLGRGRQIKWRDIGMKWRVNM